MTPRIKSRQKCTYKPVAAPEDVKVGDAVFCKVGGNYFTHLITAMRGDQYQLSNNHGHVNGWTGHARVYGLCTAVDGVPRPRTAGKTR